MPIAASTPGRRGFVDAGIVNRVNTAQWYREFAREARDESATYERLALAVAEDDELLGRLNHLPEPKRQPNLLFAATRYLAARVSRRRPSVTGP